MYTKDFKDMFKGIFEYLFLMLRKQIIYKKLVFLLSEMYSNLNKY